jgi:hypothetical protein
MKQELILPQIEAIQQINCANCSCGSKKTCCKKIQEERGAL